MTIPNGALKTRDEIIEVLTSPVKKDLHIHTYFSDGELSPEEVVDRWDDAGFRLISITDHDGIRGSESVADYAGDKGIGFISGIEFDSTDTLGRDIHMLGYGFDYKNRQLTEALESILIERADRNEKMMNALNEMGYSMDLDDVMKVNEGRYVGKPTFAHILVKKGYVDPSQDVYTTVFREPKIRRIHKRTLGTKEVIELIHAAGGVAVFAHPMEQRHLDETYNQFRERLFIILERMIEYGIDGIECYHPSADAYQAEALAKYADNHGLFITEGSDFHSVAKRRDFTRYHRP